MPIDCPIDDIQQRAVRESLESINKVGLRPLSQIESHVLVNPVTQIQRLDDNICVNYVNLSGATKAEVASVLEIAITEEYCGVYGISLERQWPFQRFSSPDLLEKEASERLMNCVVFVLKPPILSSITYTLPGTKRPTELAFYQVDGELDGFSQQRGKSLVATTDAHSISNRITEVKTNHSFPREEMLAVLVPEHMMKIASSIYKDIKIIPVPTKLQRFTSIPEILSKFHDETITAPLVMHAPDFLSTLSTFIAGRKIEKFSLHAVRLHTTFDFVVRPMINLSKNEELRDAIHARLFKHSAEEDNGWIVIHKNWGLSKQPLFDALVWKRELPQGHIDKMRLAVAPNEELYRQLIKTKGPVSINHIYADLSKGQLVLLDKLDVHVVKHAHYYVISSRPEVKPKVTEIIDNFESIQSLCATKIQSVFRGFFARKTVEHFKAKQDELARAQDKFNVAEAKLRSLCGYDRS